MVAKPPAPPDRLRPDVVGGGWCGAMTAVEVLAIVIALVVLVAAAFALGFVVGAG